MSGALKLQPKIATAVNRIRSCEGTGDGFNCEQYYPLNLRLNNRKLFTSTSLSLRRQQQSHQLLPDSSHRFISTVGSSSPSPATVTQLTHWTFTHGHIRILYFVASAAAISATWLFCSAIPALLAFKRAAESMEKLMEVTREELPDTMAAVRLSGMEISDLTMELSDLGQEITQGVRSSTRAVRLAEERLRRLTNMTPSVPMQEVAPMETRVAGPVLARTARNVKEGIVKGRAILQILFTLTRYSGIAFNYFRTRAKT